MGHTTVQQICHETCKAIVQQLKDEVMRIPTTDEWKEISNQFWRRCGFPNCVGAIDGKHVTIQAPRKSGSLFYNYKKAFSVVLLAIADSNYNFIAVDVGGYGKNSDGGILSSSELGKALQNGNLNIPVDSFLPGTSLLSPFVIVGDEAFPLKKYLMRPFPQGQIDDNSKKNFNQRLTLARRYVENTFGILAQKFRIYNRRIQTFPIHVDYIIYATCVLHNFIKKHDGFNPPLNDVPTETPRAFENLHFRGGNAAHQAFAVRETFKSFFISYEDYFESIQ